MDFDMNSLCVPRTAAEAIGGIARLEHQSKPPITCNVEYNQLGEDATTLILVTQALT